MQGQSDQGANWERALIEKALLENVQEQRRARRWRGFYKFLFFAFIIIVLYLSFRGAPKQVTKDHVAQIDLIGAIGQQQEIESDEVIKSLKQAFDKKQAKAILLRINSPGGAPVQSAYIYDEIIRLRKAYPNKKVYAVIADICASGAYFIASAADEIYANPSSLVGSIGVIMPGFGFVESMNKLGVEQRSLAAGNNKMFLDPFSPKDPSQVDFAKGLLDQIHQHFIDAVKAGRGDRLKDNSEVFSGLFWTGDKAVELGLIDGLGDDGYVKREIIDLEETVDYSPTSNLLDKMTQRLGVSVAKQLAVEAGLRPYQLN